MKDLKNILSILPTEDWHRRDVLDLKQVYAGNFENILTELENSLKSFSDKGTRNSAMDLYLFLSRPVNWLVGCGNVNRLKLNKETVDLKLRYLNKVVPKVFTNPEEGLDAVGQFKNLFTEKF